MKMYVTIDLNNTDYIVTREVPSDLTPEQYDEIAESTFWEWTEYSFKYELEY